MKIDPAKDKMKIERHGFLIILIFIQVILIAGILYLAKISDKRNSLMLKDTHIEVKG